MSINKNACKKIRTGPGLTCDHCHEEAPATIELASGQACGICAQALKFSDLVDELSAMHESTLQAGLRHKPPYAHA